MKYVDWVQRVLTAAAEETLADSDARLMGVPIARMAELLGFGQLATTPEFHDSNERMAILDAVEDLRRMGLADGDDAWHIRLSQAGRKGLKAPLTTAWPTIAVIDLDDEQIEFLAAVVELTERPNGAFARTEWVKVREVFANLSWDFSDLARAYDLAAKLDEARCIVQQAFGGGTINVAATYMGIVRATETAETELHMYIRGLLEDWETTTVEFKLDVNLRTQPGKGEFVHDLLALATTKASGRRVMVIGFDDSTHAFAKSVDPSLSQDRIEQILSAYADPAPDVRYRTLSWDNGTVGVIEVLRDPSRIPYRFKRAVGRYKALEVFVRHGSQVEPPTARELEALEREGRLAAEQAA